MSKFPLIVVDYSLHRLFELVELVDLDLSYNSLHCLSRDISKLVYDSECVRERERMKMLTQ